MRPTLVGRIKRYTLSVRLSVRVHDLLEIGKAYKPRGDMSPNRGNWESTIEVQMSKIKVTGNENVKIVFPHIFARTGSI